MNLNIDLSNVEKITDTKLEDVKLEEEEKEEKEEESEIKQPGNLKLALNLEEVSAIKETEELLSEFDLGEEYAANIVAAIGAGIATESVINSRILQSSQAIEEGRALVKTVVRQGKLVKKNICPEGFRVAKSGMCERMSSRDIIAYKKRAMKAAKTRMRRKPTAASAKMRSRSLLVRSKNAGRVNKVMPAAASTQVK
jgi:hypothetical protein